VVVVVVAVVAVADFPANELQPVASRCFVCNDKYWRFFIWISDGNPLKRLGMKTVEKEWQERKE